MRRDFAGIIVFISRNSNKIMAQNFRKMPQTHLISASLKVNCSLHARRGGEGPEIAAVSGASIQTKLLF